MKITEDEHRAILQEEIDASEEVERLKRALKMAKLDLADAVTKARRSDLERINARGD